MGCFLYKITHGLGVRVLGGEDAETKASIVGHTDTITLEAASSAAQTYQYLNKFRIEVSSEGLKPTSDS